MKTVYILETQAWNGTVLIQNIQDVFDDKFLAEETMHKLNELDANENNTTGPFSITRKITETNMFETRDDVKILSGKNEV